MLTVRTVQGTGQKEDAHRLRSATTNLCIIKKERMEISQYYTLSKKSLIIDLSAAFFELTGTSVEFTYLFIDDKSGHCLLLSHPQKEVCSVSTLYLIVFLHVPMTILGCLEMAPSDE